MRFQKIVEYCEEEVDVSRKLEERMELMPLLSMMFKISFCNVQGLRNSHHSRVPMPSLPVQVPSDEKTVKRGTNSIPQCGQLTVYWWTLEVKLLMISIKLNVF
jgi:hypothetical protein